MSEQRCLCEQPHPLGMHKIELLQPGEYVDKEQIREHLRRHMENVRWRYAPEDRPDGD